MGAGEHPTVAAARGLRALAQELADASAAAPDDANAWRRVALAEALVGALDTTPRAAAYEVTYSVHRAVDDHDAVLAVVRAATASTPPS